MKITRLCYNNVKRKKVQILLALFFLLAFTVCFYVHVQQPRKTVIFIDDLNGISKELSKAFLLKPKEVQDFSFVQNGREETFSDNEAENFKDDIERSTTKSTDMRQFVANENNSNMFGENKSGYIEDEFREETQANQDENIPFSLQGFLNLHVWGNVCNVQVESLREFILFPQAPSKRRFLTSSSNSGEKENNFGGRMFGFISPSENGEYQLAISSSGNSDLWLSSDETSANLRKIASLDSRDNPGRGEPINYSTDSSQVSASFYLAKNMKYLIDVLHKHQSGKVHLEVAWRLAREAEFNVITSKFLWAKMNDSHVADNAVRLADYDERAQQSRDSVPPFVNSEDVNDVLPECSYEPSYLVKHQLVRFQVSDITVLSRHLLPDCRFKRLLTWKDSPN